jgi:hypothetical protein
LGIAASEAMEGKDLYGMKKDFNQINAILNELIDSVKTNISTVSPIFGWLIPLAKDKDEMALNFSIQLARDDYQYSGEYHLAPDKSLQIKNRDINISKHAEKLINPEKFLSFLLKIVSFAEWKSVSKIMDQQEVVVKKSRLL